MATDPFYVKINVVVSPRFDFAWSFSDRGLASAQLGDKWGTLIVKDGKCASGPAEPMRTLSIASSTASAAFTEPDWVPL
jgi:hypothetical protein